MSSISLPISAGPAVPAKRHGRVIEPRTRRNWTWLIIVGLMLLSAVWRFYSINVPVIWRDESAVFWRTCGTYQQMTEILRNDGFVPLHYSYYWALRQFVPLTPFVLRLLPTLAAICLVPAMYFLASQLVSRRTALAVAAFAAFSSHIGWHAQDAKMYSHFWLMCVLCMGCFLWWLRGGGGLAFWTWVATGVCAAGLHSLGWGIIALQPLFFIARGKPADRSWRRFALTVLIFVVGLAIIGIGPAGYYLGFNRWTDNIQSRGWDASGIAWIRLWFVPDGVQLVRDTTNHFLFGIDFPPPAAEGVTPGWLYEYAPQVPFWVFGFLAICLFPFPTRNRGRGVSQLPMAWWRVALYLSAWVLLPPYAFYCASIEGYVWPHEVISDALTALGQSLEAIAIAIAIAVMAFYFCAASWTERFKRLAGLLIISLVILAAATGIAIALRNRPPGPVWVSRYLTIVWPGFVIAAFALLGRLPVPPVRWLIITALIAADVYMGAARLQWRQDAPIDLLAADFIAAQAPGSTTMARALGMSPRARLSAEQPGRYYLFLYSGRATYPQEFESGNVGAMFKLPDATVTENIVRDLRAAPQTTRIIVWQDVPLRNGSQHLPPMPPDRLLARLPKGWRCASEKLYPYAARHSWGQLMGAWSRREFEAPAGTTQP